MIASSFARTGTRTLSLVFALAACQGQSDDIIAVEQNELGITELRIDHRTEGADRFLDVVGLNASGEELASATLRTGLVRYSYDGENTGEPTAAGTELSVTVGELTQSYTSPDREAHDVFMPPQQELATFVKLKAVGEALHDEAGIGFFEEQPAAAESPYFVSTCYGGIFPIDKGNPSQCCRNDYHMWHKIASGANLNKLAYRTYYPNVCRTSGGATGCNDTTNICYFGPCGGHIEDLSAYPNTTAAAVFYPTNTTTNCGADSNGTAAGGYTVSQSYSGSQTLYPGVTATCPYNSCARANGYPSYVGSAGFNLTLTASCMDSFASGSVTWNGYTVSCSGIQTNSITVWAPDASTKEVYASGTIYLWSGSCSGGSGYCAGAWTTDTTARMRFSGCSPNAC
jgi:hypothetical protein